MNVYPTMVISSLGNFILNLWPKSAFFGTLNNIKIFSDSPNEELPSIDKNIKSIGKIFFVNLLPRWMIIEIHVFLDRSKKEALTSF